MYEFYTVILHWKESGKTTKWLQKLKYPQNTLYTLHRLAWQNAERLQAATDFAKIPEKRYGEKLQLKMQCKQEQSVMVFLSKNLN